MNLKRIKEIEKGNKEAVRYYKERFRPGPWFGNWTVNGSKETPYALNYYPDGTFDCSCPSYLFRKECKHIRVMALMVRLREVYIPEGHVRKPLKLSKIHYEVLKWFVDNGIDNIVSAVTTRTMISRMRTRECLHADQTFRGRTSELFKAGLLKIIEPVTRDDDAPPSSHYYISKQGKEAISR